MKPRHKRYQLFPYFKVHYKILKHKLKHWGFPLAVIAIFILPKGDFNIHVSNDFCNYSKNIVMECYCSALSCGEKMYGLPNFLTSGIIRHGRKMKNDEPVTLHFLV